MTNNNQYLQIEGNILKRCAINAIGEIIIPNGIEEIESNAFQDCCLITKIVMPNSVLKLGWTNVFCRCTQLVSIELSNNLKSIPSDCFCDCINLKQISIPQSVKEINSKAFCGCYNLQSVVLPESLQYIYSETFMNCKSLRSISLPNHISHIGQKAFHGCNQLIELVVPESVSFISDEAFSQCTSLTIVKIFSKNIEISPTAFLGCLMINQLYLANFKPLIALASFADCTNLNFISPIDTGGFTEQTISSSDLHKKLSKDIKYMSLFYRLFGMNITQMKWKDSIKNNKSFKEPIDSNWANYKTKEQDLNYILSRNWEASNGIGLILGYNEYRAIDVDGVNLFLLECSDGEDALDKFIDEFLKILGLPSYYPWVVYSGSGNGFHIIFKSPDIGDELDSLSLQPNDKYDHGDGNGLFKRIELRWCDHLVLPPSLHVSGNQYSFRNRELPTTQPKDVSLSQLDILLNTYTSKIVFSKINFNNQTIFLAEKRKIYSRHDSYLSPHETTKDSINWLKNSKSNESLNSLALRYLLGIDVNADIEKAKELFLKANTQTSLFNIVSLYACGFYDCKYSEYLQLYNQIDKNIFKKDLLDTIDTYASNNIKIPLFLFFDTETTGLPIFYDAPSSDTNNWPRLVQLSWVVTTEDGKIISKYNYIIKPEGFSIPSSSTNIHGITNQYAIDNGFSLKYVLGIFRKDLSKCAMIIGHNVDFDKKIIGAELIRLGKTDVIQSFKSFCTMKSTVDFCKLPGRYGYDYPELWQLYQILFKEKFEGAHNALNDVIATYRCFYELKKRALISLPSYDDSNGFKYSNYTNKEEDLPDEDLPF